MEAHIEIGVKCDQKTLEMKKGEKQHYTVPFTIPVDSMWAANFHTIKRNSDYSHELADKLLEVSRILDEAEQEIDSEKMGRLIAAIKEILE